MYVIVQHRVKDPAFFFADVPSVAENRCFQVSEEQAIGLPGVRAAGASAIGS